MTMTMHDAAAIGEFDHPTAMELQAAELAATLDLLRTLDDREWATKVPACPAWDVRQMYLHVLGACEGAAMREMMHQMTAAMRRRRKEGGPLEASLSAVQVADRADLTPAELVARLERVAPRVVRQRRRMPGVMRSLVRMKVDGPVEERWRLGYLVDTIYLRDLWMHRIDACQALGRQPVLTPDHDGRIVADVVGEWARRHGQRFTLELTGPAGGRFVAGDGGETLVLDAIDFCRLLSGRSVGEAPTHPLLATIVPF